jgi:RNA polymerase sigma-70 factor (ECF subfamily)
LIRDNDQFMWAAETTRPTLLLRLRDRSDSLSWEEFHDRYGELLYRYARSRGAKHADAEDIVQEVEMCFFKALPGFEYDARKGRFRAYLRSAVIHTMGRLARKEAHRAAPLDPHTFDFVSAHKDAGADAGWAHEWRQHRFRWALRSVVGDFEEVTVRAFQLNALEGVPAEETAKRLGLGKASVYQAKSRVLKRVRDLLQTLDPDEEV